MRNKKTTNEILLDIGNYCFKQIKLSYHFIWSEKGLMILVGGLLLVAGSPLLNSLMTNWIMKPVLSYFDFTGMFVQVSFFILTFFILITQVVLIKNAFKPSFSTVYFSLFFLIAYTIFRSGIEHSVEWYLVSLGKLKVIYLLDIFYLLLIHPLYLGVDRFFGGTLKLIKKIKYWNGGEESNTTFFSEDIPIAHEKNNLTNPTYQQIANDLATNLSHQDFKEAFSVGIIGPWGSGKSSFINHVLKIAKDQNHSKKKIKIIKFYPAYNHSPEQIINDFFATLIDGLKKYDGRLRSTLLSYSLKLVEATVNKKKDLQALLSSDNYLMRKRPVHKLYQELSEIIRKLPIKPIIVIDDIDRLKADEILEVLRIIRNTANFPNTIFLVAFDKEFIVQSLKKENQCFSYNYIDKYFQLELYLPQHKNKVLRLHFLNLLNKQFNQPNKNKKEIYNAFKKYIVESEDSTFDRFVNNPREVIRLFNSYILHIDLLNEEKEIDYIDLLYFIIFKSNYSALVNYLYRNLTKFFKLDQLNKVRWTYQIHENKLEIREYFTENCEEFNLSKAELSKFFSLIEVLWGKFVLPGDLDGNLKVNEELARRGGTMYRIFAPNRMDIYFNLLLSSDELSLSQFFLMLKTESQDSFMDFIKQQTNNNTHSSIREEINRRTQSFRDADIDTLTEFEKIISCYLFINDGERNVCNIIGNITNASGLANRNIIDEEYKIVQFITEKFGSDCKFEMSLKESFDLWEMIEYSYKNLGNDSDSAFYKWGGKNIDDYYPFRRYLVQGFFEVNSKVFSAESILLYQSLNSSDIITKEELNVVITFGIFNLAQNKIELKNILQLIDAEYLMAKGVIKSISEISSVLKNKVFLNKSLNVHYRLGAFYSTFENYQLTDFQNKKLGISNQGEVLDIREALVKEQIEVSNKVSWKLIEICASQMDLSYSSALRDQFKLLLLQSKENLKTFIDLATIKETEYTYYPHGFVQSIFKSSSLFSKLLSKSKFSDEDFVKEFIWFSKIDRLLHIEDQFKTPFNFENINPNLDFFEASKFSLVDEWTLMIFQIKNKQFRDSLLELVINESNKFQLIKHTNLLVYNNTDSNLDNFIKRFNTLINRGTFDYMNCFNEKGEIKLMNDELHYNDKKIGEIFYSCKYKN